MTDREATLKTLEKIILFRFIRAWIEQVYILEDQG